MGILIEENKYRLKLLKLLKSDIKKVAFPKLIVLQTMNRCNCACSMCPYSYTIANEEKTLMSENLYEKILDEISQESGFETMIMAFQNEPLLDNRIVTFAKMFKEKLPDKNLELVTNGTLLAENVIDSIYRYFDTVHISVNAFSKTTHRMVSNTDTYEKILSNIELISEKKLTNKTILRFIKQKDNYTEKDDFKKYWNSRGFKVFGFDVNNRLAKVKHFNEKIKVPRFKKDILKMKAFKYLGKMLVPTCPIPFLVFYIKSNGDVVQCFNDWSGKNILGNIHDSSIRSIYTSNKYKEIRKLLLADKLDENVICENCDLYKEGIWLTA
jgi:radical SAM protein with 4Fe4S-binding SPASM domain